MKPNLTGALSFATLLLVLYPPLPAEDWTTIYGHTYPNVTVVKTEPDAVTILYKNGGALIPLADLPPDLQKRFNYDPLLAQNAADARAAADAASRKALADEKAQAAQIRKAEQAQSKAAVAAYKAQKAHHDGMPSEPAILEAEKKQNDDVFAKPK